jgi:DeoR/GlpR family transcriptional regulator of sugar metabolism
MFSQITAWLKERGSATVAELALHFDMDTAAMDGILQTLERKGRVECVGGGKCAACKGCALVNPADAAIYKAV